MQNHVRDRRNKSRQPKETTHRDVASPLSTSKELRKIHPDRTDLRPHGHLLARRYQPGNGVIAMLSASSWEIAHAKCA